MQLILLAVVTTFGYAKSACLVLPTEISYSAYSSQCAKNGYPNKFQCPYEYPYAEELMQQPRRICNKNGCHVSCESTKVCCTTSHRDVIPNNKEKLKELMVELSESNNSKDMDTIESIKSILTPPPPIVELQPPSTIITYVSGILFLLIFTIIFMFALNCVFGW